MSEKRSVVQRFARRVALGSLSIATTVAIPAAAMVATSATLIGCADENDPQTWVKRLDDPAQRTPAIKRLGAFFEDAMTKANNKRDDPGVVAVLDKIADPLAKQYTAGNLDEKTRKELIKLLASTQDARTAPALAKAFNEYEAGKNDDDVKFAAQAVSGLAEGGKLQDQNLIDALWNCFSKFQASKAKSSNLVKDLHDAVLAVKSPTYGPKAVEKLAAPVDPQNQDSVRDQLMFWQLTAIQVIGETKFAPAAKILVTTLLTPAKEGLRATVVSALLRIPKEGQAQLIAALGGKDAEYNKLAEAYGPEKTHIAFLGDALAYISRPEGKDAVIRTLDNPGSDTNRVILAQSLYRFPYDAKVLAAFQGAYAKTPASFDSRLLGGVYGRTALVQVAGHFYDPSLVDWVLKEVATASGDETEALHSEGLKTAMKLMPAGKVRAVADAVGKYGSALDKQVLGFAQGPVDKCKEEHACYLAVLDEIVPSSPKGANMRHIKAAYMLGALGNVGTAKQLADKLDKVKDPGARLAVIEAIDHLCPKGDNAISDIIDKVVEGDKSGGNAALLAADDALVKVSLAMRARAQ
jgi:uncharacterized protein (DUF1778 family)